MLLRHLYSLLVVLGGRVDSSHLVPNLLTTEVLSFHPGTLDQMAFPLLP